MGRHNNRDQLRKCLLKQRSALSTSQRKRAARALVSQLLHVPQILKAKRLISYVPVRGEISAEELLKHTRAESIYIPQITDYAAGQMRFCLADDRQLKNLSTLSRQQLKLNQFKIPEPTVNNLGLPPRLADVVFVPLVAFDLAGNRIGMGAGFYDRAFAFRKWHITTRKPLLVGLAHAFQQVDAIAKQPWDVPLDVIITPEQTIWV